MNPPPALRLVGPLVRRLSWLRDAVRQGDAAAKKAPLNAQEARNAVPWVWKDVWIGLGDLVIRIPRCKLRAVVS